MSGIDVFIATTLIIIMLGNSALNRQPMPIDEKANQWREKFPDSMVITPAINAANIKAGIKLDAQTTAYVCRFEYVCSRASMVA
ncbi:hypothetical protein M5M_08230 [Simiduia agarivorans SA1 = DSM 21679]|uniref:Uncharacterized protein n=1 Tax=Simiduia agarivorans (strain DSM 21679 / JCM 13881 / BCRC 17597 / SA1) TaxID=1117647 RepID=K4KKT2_SIMAS|nr:hypothetical protein M5M_08230 [Simiduia agarivorans SA1 = DSM 21679]